MFAKDFSNKLFSPQRQEDKKLNYKNHQLFLCLGAFVAILSDLSGLGICKHNLQAESIKRSCVLPSYTLLGQG
jgi:hypothetical protein